MSGQSFRSLLNGYFHEKSLSYLEIGVWKGSTICSVIDGNTVIATCIDNWTEFEGPHKIAVKNIGKKINDSCKISIINRDYKSMNFANFLEGSTDVYFFDGPHAEEDHVHGARIVSSLNFDTLLFIVDDWNIGHVRRGTTKGLESINHKIVGKIEIFTDGKKLGRQSRWHNGYAFFVISK
jgi:hypothetical protein